MCREIEKIFNLMAQYIINIVINNGKSTIIKCVSKKYKDIEEVMEISRDWKDYEIIDMANGEKLERWGDVILIRPDPQAIFKTDRKEFTKLYLECEKLLFCG